MLNYTPVARSTCYEIANFDGFGGVRPRAGDARDWLGGVWQGNLAQA